MNKDEKTTGDEISGEGSSVQEANEMEEIIDLVDAASADGGTSQVTDRPANEASSEESEEALIELTDLVEEPFVEQVTGEAVLEGQSGEVLSHGEEAADEEGIIELVDAVDSAPESEDQEPVELTDVAEEKDLQGEEVELSRLSGDDLSAEGSDEDHLMEDVGIEMPGTSSDIPFVEEPAEGSGMSQGLKEAATDTGDLATDLGGLSESGVVEPAAGAAADPSALHPEQGPPLETGAQPTDEALEPTVREQVSDERIEAIITRVAQETIEKKADRILLEVAEAAIAKEIEKIKQAL